MILYCRADILKKRFKIKIMPATLASNGLYSSSKTNFYLFVEQYWIWTVQGWKLKNWILIISYSLAFFINYSLFLYIFRRYWLLILETYIIHFSLPSIILYYICSKHQLLFIHIRYLASTPKTVFIMHRKDLKDTWQVFGVNGGNINC